MCVCVCVCVCGEGGLRGEFMTLEMSLDGKEVSLDAGFLSRVYLPTTDILLPLTVF